MNKSLKIYLGIFTIFLQSLLFGRVESIYLSLKPDFGYAFVKPKGYESWKGFQAGAIISAELKSDNIKYFSMEYESGIINEKYFLPEANFNKDSFLSILNLNNGLGFVYFLNEEIYMSAGLEFVTQISGNFGDKNFKKNISGEYLGTDTYFKFKTGYKYKINSKVFIPVELRVFYDLSIKDSSVLNFGIAPGIGLIITF